MQSILTKLTIVSRLAIVVVAALFVLVLVPSHLGQATAYTAIPGSEPMVAPENGFGGPASPGRPRPKGWEANPAAACTFSLGSSGICFNQSGGNSSVSLGSSPPTGCPWTAVSNAPWITITSPTSGDGPTDIQFQVSANNTFTARQGTLTIAGLTFTVSQTSSFSCALPLFPSSQSFPASGGSGQTEVPLPSECSCSWSASTDFPDWITITSGTTPSSTKNTFTYTIAPNMSNSPRTGDIQAAGQDFTINQASECTYALSSSTQSFGSDGGSGTFNLTTGSLCTWSAAANVPWITITSSASGSGNTQIAYSVAANATGLARTGVISIGGQAFSISQDGIGCGYSLSPGFLETGSSSATGAINVSATAGCAWTATSNQPWITITSSATGSGNGSVSFALASNAGGSARSGAISVADQTFTIDQAGPSDQADLSVSVTASPQPVAAGTQLTYTTTVTNSGPSAATGVTLTEFVPNGSSFSSVTSAGVNTAPAAGQTGTVSCSLGAIPSGKSATVTLVVNVLASPGNALTLTAQAQSLAADPMVTNNSVTSTTQIVGGGVVSLSWSQSPSTPDQPTPAPTSVTVGIATNSQTAAQNQRSLSAGSPAESRRGLIPAPPAKQPRASVIAPTGDSTCSLTGYNIYISAATPVQIVPANLWETVPPSSTAPVPAGPSGSFYVVTSLWNCGGSIVESGPGLTDSGTDAGVPAGPVISSVIIGKKIKATGSGFGTSVQVFIDGVAFVKQSVLRKATLVIQKGALSDGDTISQSVSGKTVLITFQNPDGGIGTFTFTGQ